MRLTDYFRNQRPKKHYSLMINTFLKKICCPVLFDGPSQLPINYDWIHAMYASLTVFHLYKQLTLINIDQVRC